MSRRDILAAAAGAVAATVLAGSVAWAAIPGPGGLIQGCYDSGGNVKVVQALPCPKGYTQLPWNQAGQPGPQGPQGIQGPPGTQGPKGEDGEDGLTGLAGQSCTNNGLVTGFDGNGDIICSDGPQPPPPPPPPPACEDNPLNVFYDGVCYQVWHIYELAVGNGPPFDRGVLLQELLVTSLDGSTLVASLSPSPNPVAPNDVEIELGTLSAPALGSRVNVLGTVLAMASDGGLEPGVAARLQGARLDVLSNP